ncbi:S-crystallin SL11 isoform X1 [Aplysia californica]|uniref:S-crystallin SL11 isoform X1 n=1 Tax=Aplysia californica TaxID=6500 RepID=A0ABM1ADC6_APLCA|nr:S-crystallin SL11 isoform X1 [Aplysia californica]
MAESKFIFHYLDLTARGEVTRLTLAAAGKEYEDARIPFEEIAQQRHRFPFEQVPVLEIDGKMYTQSFAINCYIAKEFGIYGDNNLERLLIDQVLLLIKSIFDTASHFLSEKDPAKKVAKVKEFKMNTCLPTYRKLEKLLEQNGTGYFAGNRLSVAEIAVYDVTTTTLQFVIVPIDGKFPLLQANLRKTAEFPEIKAYMATRKNQHFPVSQQPQVPPSTKTA